MATSEAISDSKGRLTATYGAGGLQAGAAWPEGVVSRERHIFLYEGKAVATFVLERTSRDLRFLQDSAVASREPASSPRAKVWLE